MSKPIPLDDQLCFSVYSAMIAINRAYKPILDELGLTYTQFVVLHAAAEQDGRTVGAIAARLALEPSTVTPVVKRLEAAGLLERTRNPADQREVQIRLTPVGRSTWRRTGCLADEMVTRSGMAADTLAGLGARIRHFRDALTAGTPPTVTP